MNRKVLFFLSVMGILSICMVSCDSHDDTVNNPTSPTNPDVPTNPTDPVIPEDPSDLGEAWSDIETVEFDQNGASNAVFSVSENKTVRFSRGNLQYQPSTGTWRFAERQYKFTRMLGDENWSYSSTYSGWIDMFCYGTSGWNSGAAVYQPWGYSTDEEDYVDYDLTGDYANADWGVYNSISNGGNQPGMWRTLTRDEWFYLLERREAPRVNYVYQGNHYSESIRYTWVSLSGKVNGMIIFPDSVSVEISIGISGMHGSMYIDPQTWQELESAGVIFLPDNSSPSDGYWSAHYWSSTRKKQYVSCYQSMRFGQSDAYPNERAFVRLVQDVN